MLLGKHGCGCAHALHGESNKGIQKNRHTTGNQRDSQNPNDGIAKPGRTKVPAANPPWNKARDQAGSDDEEHSGCE